jgi:hypothetical protein
LIARRIASASATSGATTSSVLVISHHAARQTPLWSRITTPVPILRVAEKTAASTLTKNESSGGGDHLSTDEVISRLLVGAGLYKCQQSSEYKPGSFSAIDLGCIICSPSRTLLRASQMCHIVVIIAVACIGEARSRNCSVHVLVITVHRF